jgi:SAM-dependent methyltransferase
MERIVCDRMNADALGHYTMNLHLQSYAFAHKFIFQKRILDAACGTCFGSMIYSTAAKSIVCIDKSAEAIQHGSKLPYFCPTEWMVKDIDKDLLPKADVCVSVETIEHLDGDGFFLKNLRVKQLVFTVPINHPGDFHRLVFPTPEDAMKHLWENGWKVLGATLSSDGQLMGVAERTHEAKIIGKKTGKGNPARRGVSGP